MSRSSYGNGDPQIPSELVTRHDAAVEAGLPMYQDPLSGLWVQTSAQLEKSGQCCGAGCRHCPYPRTEQQRAGRRILRPEDDT